MLGFTQLMMHQAEMVGASEILTNLRFWPIDRPSPVMYT